MTTIFSRFLLFFAICIIVAGPATAQRTVDGSRRAWDECQAKQNASPAFLALRHKIGSRASPDIAFSTDKVTLERYEMIPNRQGIPKRAEK